MMKKNEKKINLSRIGFCFIEEKKIQFIKTIDK